MGIFLASIKYIALNMLYTMFCKPIEDAIRSKPMYLKKVDPFRFCQVNPKTCSTRARIFDF
jgi:hypothetical protein